MQFTKPLALLVSFMCANASADSLVLEVSDDGEPLSMAEVILVDTQTKRIVDSQFTDKNGRYVYKKGTGLFNVMVTKNEYASGTIKNIDVQGDVVKKLDMVPSAFAETPAASGYGESGDEGCSD